MFSGTDALQVRLVEMFVGHDTFEAAIAYTQRQPQTKASVAASREITGASIEAVEWSDTNATFHLSNRKSVCISAAPNGVRWRIVDTTQKRPRAEEDYPRRLLLQYPDDSQATAWERAALLESRLNHKFVSIFHTDYILFFYTEKCPILLFCVHLVDVDDEQLCLLCWDDTD